MMQKSDKPIRVRYAPSPTGYFHIGAARTVLFNWLFARKHNGTFVLRIEDTDKERSKPEFEQNIIEGMHWLGFTYNEGIMQNGKAQGEFGPYRQSERGDIYARYIQQLLDAHHAYYCFCTTEELEQIRQSMITQGKPAIYNGTCRSLTENDVKKKFLSGKSAVIRFKTPAEKVSFTDLIRGEVIFDNALIGDIVIAKNVREPLFVFSNLIDDELMHISHVIRGEDHIANTPKQIALGKALDFHQPLFGHLPLILNPDRSKMSKRAGPTAINEYKTAGYLPEAIINFLALLGWHPVGDREVFTLAELIQEFDFSRVQKGGAIFNIEKLDWFNNHYLKQVPPAELLTKLQSAGLIPQNDFSSEQLEKIIVLTKERLRRLTDFTAEADFFFTLPAYDPALLVWKKSTPEKAKKNLELCHETLLQIHDVAFTKSTLEAALMPIAEINGRGDVLWPLRVALSGKNASPGPLEILDILGKSKALARIIEACDKLGS